MKFEVINSNGRCMQSVTDPRCVPYNFLDSMAMHGYRFRVDGKIVAKNRVKKAIDASLGIVSEDTKIDPNLFEIVGVDLAASTTKTTPTRGKAPIAIMCVEDNLTFKSQSDAAEHYGISAMSVSKSIKTGKPTKGHTFKKI